MLEGILESLKVEGVQSLDDIYLEFVPGINAIIGDNDSGKSAFLRALWLLVMNEPGGDEYISHWVNAAIVTGKTSEGNEIKRTRKSHKTTYEVNGKLYETVGVGTGKLPKAVKEALRLSELNFQMQHDPPFLFSKNPSDVARFLNTIVDLSIIDSSLSNANKEKLRLNSKKNFVEGEVEECKEKLKELDWINEAEKEVKEVEQLKKEIVKLEKREEKLSNLLINIKETKKEIKKYKPMTKALKEIKNLEKLSNEVEALEKRKSMLDNLIDKIKETKQSIKKLGIKIEELDKQFHKLMPRSCPLCGQKIKGERR